MQPLYHHLRDYQGWMPTLPMLEGYSHSIVSCIAN